MGCDDTLEPPTHGSNEPRTDGRRDYEIIALTPDGFMRRKCGNIRQLVVQAEWLLETGATKVGLYVHKNL